MSVTSVTAPPRYRERLTVPWWWWPAGGVAGVIAGAELRLGFEPVVDAISYAGVATLVLGVLVTLGRSRIVVTGETLRADRTSIPLGRVQAVACLEGDRLRHRLGAGANPAAVLVVRGWIGQALEISLDPSARTDADPPYLLVSTRHPQELAAAIAAFRAG